MDAAIAAGTFYFGLVFAAGFALGAIRVLALVPRFGEVAPVLLETPVMLAISWLVSDWTARRFQVSSATSQRLAMGIVAFALLMVAEVVVSIFAFGKPIEEHFAAYRSSPGFIGFVAQVAFALFPLMQGRLR
jgi:hypothetical protein